MGLLGLLIDFIYLDSEDLDPKQLWYSDYKPMSYTFDERLEPHAIDEDVYIPTRDLYIKYDNIRWKLIHFRWSIPRDSIVTDRNLIHDKYINSKKKLEKQFPHNYNRFCIHNHLDFYKAPPRNVHSKPDINTMDIKKHIPGVK